MFRIGVIGSTSDSESENLGSMPGSETNITGSSSGRTTDFESVNLGSNPSPVAKYDFEAL